MNAENLELSDDEITKALNIRLEEEAHQEELSAEVEKRHTKLKEEQERKKKAEEVHEATFTDKASGKKKIVKEKTEIGCASCGSTDTFKVSDDDDTFVYEGRDVSAVYQCRRCGKRSGLV